MAAQKGDGALGEVGDRLVRLVERAAGVAEEQQRIDEILAREFGRTVPLAIPEADPQRYCRLLAETFPKLRNDYAHGSSTLNFTVPFTFSLCRDLVEQLFATKPSGDGG